MPSQRSTIAFSLVLLVAGLSAIPAAAQSAKPDAPPAAAATKPKKDSGVPAAAAGNEAALRQRVEQLEEQLIDLQVVIGTLESLAKPPPGQGPGAPPAADMQRIQALEAQLKTLSQQIEQLGEKVRGAGEPMRRSEQGAPPSAPSPVAGAPSRDTTTVGSATVTSSDPREQSTAQAPQSWQAQGPPAPQPNDAPQPNEAPQYETAPGAALPPIGEAPQAAPSAAPAPDVAALEQPADPADAKHDYETAYSFIIQRDYPSAQAGFTAFMKRHPKDALVPNALYWLGETHYQQRNFADAAEAFDLVTKMYATSPKAADSQLKRALSYSALGKNNEACAALSELDVKFDGAPAYVKTRAGSERRRLGCTG